MTRLYYFRICAVKFLRERGSIMPTYIIILVRDGYYYSVYLKSSLSIQKTEGAASTI